MNKNIENSFNLEFVSLRDITFRLKGRGEGGNRNDTRSGVPRVRRMKSNDVLNPR